MKYKMQEKSWAFYNSKSSNLPLSTEKMKANLIIYLVLFAFLAAFVQQSHAGFLYGRMFEKNPIHPKGIRENTVLVLSN